MPHGRRKAIPTPIAKQLEELNVEIAKYQTQLDKANDRKKALLKRIKDEEKEALYTAALDATKKKGVSIEQIIQELQQQVTTPKAE